MILASILINDLNLKSFDENLSDFDNNLNDFDLKSKDEINRIIILTLNLK